MKINAQQLAGMIDHTLLQPTARRDDIRRLCREAREFNFAAVCVHPFYVPCAARQLQGTAIPVCAVVGFPLGAATAAVKTWEAREAVSNGAGEIDLVINIGALKEKRIQVLTDEIKAVVQGGQEAAAERASVVLVKVILETCYLNDEEKVLACQLAGQAGAHFVKTSTGYGTAGATLEDVKLLRQTVGSSMGVKASGGIKNAAWATALIEAGANRIGASAGVAIVRELAARQPEKTH